MEKVEVIGNARYSDSSVLEMLNLKEGVSLVDIFFLNQENLPNYPYIDYVGIEYVGNNHVVITVEEKRVVMYVKYMDDYLAVDKLGYILDMVNENDLNNFDETIPIATGIDFNQAVVGEVIDVEQQILECCLRLYQGGAAYGVDIDYIYFLNNDVEEVSLMVGNKKVEFGNRNEEVFEKIEALSKIISELDDEESGEIDMSYEKGKIIYKNDKK